MQVKCPDCHNHYDDTSQYPECPPGSLFAEHELFTDSAVRHHVVNTSLARRVAVPPPGRTSTSGAVGRVAVPLPSDDASLGPRATRSPKRPVGPRYDPRSRDNQLDHTLPGGS